MALEPGTQVTDKVRLLRRLGEGAMGEVWVGEHATLACEVAVKFVSPEMAANSPTALERFSVEAAAAAQIKSPHVVRTFDHGNMTDGTPYIVMELLEGESLQERLEGAGPLSINDTYQVIKQVGKAIDASHQANIIHRDIKPHNIFLTDVQGDMFVKVLDFGSAKRADSPRAAQLTSPGMLIGTPHYISRDLVKDTKTITGHADLWALGVVAYKCLTGKLPFDGVGIAEVCNAIVKGKFRRPSRARKDLTRHYDGWFGLVFHPDPSKRPNSGLEMTVSFKAVARSSLTSTVQLPAPGAKTRERMSIGALALSIVLAAGAIVTTQTSSDDDDAATTSASATPTPTVSAAAAPSTSAVASAAVSAEPEPPEVAPVSSEVARLIDLDALDDGAPKGDAKGAPKELVKALSKARVHIPAGSFFMGCAPGDKHCADNEKPGRAVKIGKYSIDRVEVSLGLYYACVKAGACSSEQLNGYQLDNGPFVPSTKCNWGFTKRHNHPINCVSHHEAATFCKWVDARLPTEAEWENAARGRDKRIYPWKKGGASCSVAVMNEGIRGCRASGTWPAGSKRDGASPYGLFNMAGNVREWVSDWYEPVFYKNGPATDPSGPDDGTLRVGRGGSWGNAVGRFMRVSAREGMSPSNRSIHLGFRCVD
jgi:formylglycine-generating enzyme required for sulfatase activity